MKNSVHPTQAVIADRRGTNSVRDGSGFDKLLLGLALAYLVALAGLPVVYNLVMSFQQVDVFSLGNLNRPWVGFENFRAVMNDPEFAMIMINTVVFVVGSIVFQFCIGFAVALFFNLGFPGAGYMRGIFLAAWVMPGLVVGAIWNWILSGDFGVLNYVLVSSGLIGTNIFWRSDIEFSLWAIIIANIWLGIPFNMILLSVGLSGIPQDIYEAAELDGANAVQKFVTITLPMMRSTIGAVIALGVIFTLQQFDLIAAITAGGPANSSNVSQYWAWQVSFREYDFARGATISVLMLTVVLVVSVFYVRSTRHEQKL